MSSPGTMPVLEVLPEYAAMPEGLRDVAGEEGERGIDALYVHVPFCSTKCHYCDFYSVAGHLGESEAYLGALAREIEMCVRHFGRPRPRTIFIGGGTPTLLEPRDLERLLRLIRGRVEMSRVEEWTIEANPNTFEGEKARIAAGEGVNRISFGAQSFVESELRILQRDHDPENVGRAVELAREAGLENFNVDLIFGIPTQTLETWEYSLGRALELGPTHMSCYSLTYEPNTAMTARLKRGEFAAIDEETELAMFEHVYRRLREVGFERYEVSNYARVGADGRARVCRHNLHYWKGSNWLGWGPSAGSHLSGVGSAVGGGAAWRWKNVGSLSHYLSALAGESGRPPLTQMERMTERQWAAEVAVFWLRLAEGLGYEEFAGRVGVDVRAGVERGLEKYAALGLVELSGQRARILEAGVAVSNRMLADVLESLTGRRDGG